MEMFCVLTFILHCALMAMGEDTNSTVVNLSEEMAGLNKTAQQELSVLGKEKPILRYGFQKTALCKDYGKAFLCVRKCLDIGYDVAYADKRCKCTCFHKKDKAKYTPAGLPNRTNYLLGVPTTKLPAWAQPPTPETSEKDGDKDTEDRNNTSKEDESSKEDSGDDSNSGDADTKEEDGSPAGDDAAPEPESDAEATSEGDADATPDGDVETPPEGDPEAVSEGVEEEPLEDKAETPEGETDAPTE